jgi:hypothetical protein
MRGDSAEEPLLLLMPGYYPSLLLLHYYSKEKFEDFNIPKA